MAKSWLVVADSARARIFDVDRKTRSICEIGALIHTDSRMPGSELVSDRPGRSFDSVGGGRHAMSPHTSPHMREADTFARRLADYLRTEQIEGEFQRLHLYAPPTFLGLLRKHLDDNVRQSLETTVNKGLMHDTPKDIASQFFDPQFSHLAWKSPHE